MQLTVDRVELIAAITEKRDEVTARYDKVIGNVEAMIAEIEPAETVESWLRSVADLAKDDKVLVEQQPTMSSGRGTADAMVYLVVRSTARTQKGKDPVLPQFPNRTNSQLSHFQRDLNHARTQRANVVEPYDAALKILNMSSDDKVGIQDGDYHSLLSAKRSRRDFDADLEEYEDEDEG